MNRHAAHLAILLFCVTRFSMAQKNVAPEKISDKMQWFGEAKLGIFTLILTGFLTLTLIGIFFRGPGMALLWPWDVAALGH